MPSAAHETFVEMFRNRPALAVELLSDVLGLAVPVHETVRLEQTDFPDLTPTEYRADVVVVLAGGPDPVLAVVVEVQLRPDSRKRFTWPVYLTTLRSRLTCGVALLVMCVDDPTATWCATPIELGTPGSTVVPLVIGPGRIPVIADSTEAARTPELAVLSAMAHGADPHRRAVLDVLPAAFAAVDEDHALLYSDLVLAALPQAAAHYLEALMISPTHEWQSDFARRHAARGLAEGLAEGRSEGLAEGRSEGAARGRVEATVHAVLSVLAARDVDVPADARARIAGCSDLDLLDVWLRRAATVDSVRELLA